MSKPALFPRTAKPDLPDARDAYYQPRLQSLPSEITPPSDLLILNQGQEGACTGFGLAAVINRMYQVRDEPTRVSARMLYEMARRYDEWAGDDYSGSSCRGAIRGFRNMGVCQDNLWPFHQSKDSHVSRERALDARSQTLGAYYRLRHDITHFHSALHEVGAIYVSAHVHAGWDAPKNGKIRMVEERNGGHAFALVGYNSEGFWVQNSWGPGWGQNGLALWRYEDWAANVTDAWAVQVALPTPQLWESRLVVSGSSAKEKSEGTSVERHEIAGHFVHLDDGSYDDKGRYWSNSDDVREIMRCLKESSSYKHVLLYAHGGLNSASDSARRTRAMKPIWKANGVYPIHFMYDTGLMEETKDILFGRTKQVDQRVGDAFDWSDRLFERTTRRAGRALWREMKNGGTSPFADGGAGSDFLRQLVAALGGSSPKKLHVAAHSNGANLASHLVARLAQKHRSTQVESLSLMAPAATVALFDSHLRPALSRGRISDMRIYNLTDEHERSDSVGLYRKSLLYLVSRAFEEGDSPTPLLGMEIYSSQVKTARLPVKFIYTDTNLTKSTSHGGFDNDEATMNEILKSVVGKPTRKFTSSDLEY